MMNDNHKNSGCGFGELLVSYLYGETEAAENAVFKRHLDSCSMCSSELEALTGVQFAIGDWKMKEFASLATPVIEIPYERQTHKTEISQTQASWFSRLGNLFSLSPAWSLATASMAVLAVCVGIVLFVSNSQNRQNDVAENNKNTKIPAASVAEKTPVRANSNATRNIVPEIEPKKPGEQKPPQPEMVVETTPRSKPAVKTPNTARQTPKTETKSLPKTQEAKRSNKNERELPEKILEDEDEDDTLRLAEMLEEIDTVE